MVAPGEETRTTTVVLPRPALRLLSQGNGTSNGRTLGKQNLFRLDKVSTNKDEEEELPEMSRTLLLTNDVWRQKEYESVLTSNKDLASLLEGTVKCKKPKPPSTKETRKEAFDCYMRMIYRLPSDIKVDLEDTFDPNKLTFYPEPYRGKPRNPPSLKEDVRPKPKLKIPVNVEEKKVKTVSTEEEAPTTNPKPKPVVTPKKPVIVEKVEKEEEPPEVISPVEPPKTPTPPPRRRWTRTPTPIPQRDPSPELPMFLRQFADADWFKDLYPDKKCIPSFLSPDDFSLQLLGCLNTCGFAFKMKILAALRVLHTQRLLQNTDGLYQGLIDLVPEFVIPYMSPVERTVLVEMLNLLMFLKSAGYDLMKRLLTLLAFKKLSLRDTVLRILNTLGVNEAEQWLWPELESWDSELQDPSNIWKSLHDRADCWLELWISKYKEHDRYLYLRSTAQWKPPNFSVVDVLNYFCSVQKDEYIKARYVAPAGRKNTVLLPLYDCSQPILRLGETYSMARISRPPGLILPPLRSRPFLTHVPSFISFPLARVTLSPFDIHSDDDWVTASPHRYFILQQSYVDYYR